MKIDKCRLCQTGQLSEPVLNFGSTPLANEFLDHKEKQDVFPLEVCKCNSCGHYQLNQSIDPERIFRHYVYVAGTSPVNVEHFRQYAIHMVDKFDLKPGSRVLDIGSNDGTLLKQFLDLKMSVLGIDPARNLAEEAKKNGIPTIPDFFTEERADRMLKQHEKFQLITANNVWAHVPDLVDFIKGVKKLLKPQGVFSFEVSYFGDVCDKVLFDTCYHEHSSYHTLTPLISFFEKHELQVFDVERLPNHGGSIRVLVQHIGASHNKFTKTVFWQVCKICGYGGCETHCGKRDWHPPREMDFCGLTETAENLLIEEKNIERRVYDLQQKVKYLGLELREKLRDYKDQGKSIAIYGTPAKATTLLYALGIKKEWIDFAVEDNPLKVGTFTPGQHIEILPTQAIIDRKPDVLLVLAWNFAESIMKKHSYFKGEWVVPVPELKVY